VTDSWNKFDKIRDILSENKIKYDFKIKSRSPLFRGDAPLAGRYGAVPDEKKMYYIYVNKKDYGYAREILQKHSVAAEGKDGL